MSASSTSGPPLSLASGARLGPYEIVSPLGVGGMGEVYRATDTRLERVVAIKVLPDGVTASPHTLERFQREARAASALRESVERLQTALHYELAVNGLSVGLYLGGLHSAYIRGEAFMAAHQYVEAAAEFQKILDHPGIVGADPIGALAHLQLGRTFALSGDKTKAKAAYQDFLTLWKDADPDIAILRQAKSEYAKLP